MKIHITFLVAAALLFSSVSSARLSSTSSNTQLTANSHNGSTSAAQLGRPFMGFYGMPNASDLHGWGNAWFSDSPEALVAAKASFGYDRQLMGLEGYFLNWTTSGARLKTDWKTIWHNHVAVMAAPLLANGTIVGFFIGDELMWNGLPYDQLDEWTKEVRATFPSSFLWENEATDVYRCVPGSVASCPGHCCNTQGEPIPDISSQGIPSALNVTSIDLYAWGKLFVVSEDVKPFYEKYLFPRAHPGQGFFVVPGSDASRHNKHCDFACYEDTVRYSLDAFLLWMELEPKIWGMMPWEWVNCPGCIKYGDEIGTGDMPKTSKHWREEIGPAVLKMK